MNSPATPNQTPKLNSWAKYDVNEKHWLKMDVSVKSVASLISRLGIRHFNVSSDSRAFEIPNLDVCGYICYTKTPLPVKFMKGKRSRGDVVLPENVENSEATIGIAVIHNNHHSKEYSGECLLHDQCGRHDDYNTTVPIAYAHNYTARIHPPMGDEQFVYCFVRVRDQIFYIRDSSTLMAFEGSICTDQEFFKKATNEWKCETLIIVNDPLSSLKKNLNKAKLSVGFDESVTEEDLHEISKMSTDIDDAENFELVCVGGDLNQSISKEENDEQSLKRAELRKSLCVIDIATEVFPHIQWDDVDFKWLTSKDYFDFYIFYVPDANHLLKSQLPRTPKTPLTTQKSVESRGRRRRSRRADDGSIESTPKRSMREIRGL